MVRPFLPVVIIWWTSHLSNSFPIRHLGHLKDVTTQHEQREHILCWNVQIVTHSKCVEEEDAWGPGTGKNSGPRTSSGPDDSCRGVIGPPVRCGSSQQSVQHAQEIASELNLAVVSVFQEFHDHYLLCHVRPQPQPQAANASTSNGNKNISLKLVHRQHKAIDRNIFFCIKRDIERQLTSHHEIVHFSQEFAFRRHSRLIQTNLSPVTAFPSLNKSKGNSQSSLHVAINSQEQSLVHDFTSLSNILNSKFPIRDRWKSCWDTFQELDKGFSRVIASVVSERKKSAYHDLVIAQRQGVAREGGCQCPGNVSSHQSVSLTDTCFSAFCTLLNNHSDWTKPPFIFSTLAIIPKHSICCLFSSPLLRYHCEVAFLSLQGFYTKCFTQFQRHPFINISHHHHLKILSSVCANHAEHETERKQDFPVYLLERSNSKQDKSPNFSIQSQEDQLNKEQANLSLTVQNDGRPRIRRSLVYRRQVAQFNDPAFPLQWHLVNRVTPAMDINVTGVWANNVTGQGVTVAVVDDGVEWNNPDLKENYNYHGSWDLNDDDPDPSPSTKKVANHHGTRCAGEIAAVANNQVCGVGVAFKAQISGLRVLDGIMTDSLEAEAFNKKMDINDIYSCSWGPDDDGKTVDGPHLMAAKAMKHGVDFGRKGYGSIFVVASGNGGSQHDNCNFDGYANSIYTVTIGAVDENGRMPYYAEECASMLGVTFSSGMSNKRDIVTTDWMHQNSKGCTEKHTGTSAAAPLAAGMIALMLSARPCLTWRDVQYILILTAKKVDVDIAHWQKNGAGLSHSHKHGFGLLSAWRMVNAARVWQSVPWMTSFSFTQDDTDALIPKGSHNPLVISHVVQAEDVHGYGLAVLENVQVTLWLSHPCRGKLGIQLTSPSGTVSVIAAPRPKDSSALGFQGWTFTTVRNWGESPIGNWTLEVKDKDLGKFEKGKVAKWRLTLFGTPMTPSEFSQRQRLVESAMDGHLLHSNHSVSCPPPPEYSKEPARLSEKTLKILVLVSAFCLVMAVYETLEYLFCYGDEKKEHARDMKMARRAWRRANSALSGADNSDGDEAVCGDTDGVSGLDGANSSALVRSHLNRDNEEDDEDEDDIFEAPETQRLLSNSSSRKTAENKSRATHPLADRGQPAPECEAIPLSTFSTSTNQKERTGDHD